jgi:NAD(P)-dependent dehydrogenase (short-subunit alcohol dehydrogenase family)
VAERGCGLAHALLHIKGRRRALTESLALDLAPDIPVNAIAPWLIVAPPGLTAEENAEVLAATPLGRWGSAAEIAKAVLFLIETEFVTGASAATAAAI